MTDTLTLGIAVDAAPAETGALKVVAAYRAIEVRADAMASAVSKADAAMSKMGQGATFDAVTRAISSGAGGVDAMAAAMERAERVERAMQQAMEGMTAASTKQTQAAQAMLDAITKIVDKQQAWQRSTKEVTQATESEDEALDRITRRMREAKAAREAQAQAAQQQKVAQEALNTAVAAGAGGKVSNAGLLAADVQSVQKTTEAVGKLTQARVNDATVSAKASSGVVRDSEAQTIALARLDARLGLITKSDLAYATAEAELSRLLRQGTIDADQHASRLAVLNKALDDGRIAATATAGAHVRLTGAARDTFDAISAGGSPVSAIVMQFSSLEKGITAANVAMLAMGAGVGVIAGGIALLAAASIKAGDELTKTEGRLAAVTGSVGAARETYDGLYQISQKTGIAVADSANQFVRFNIAAGEIGATRREVLQLVETVQKFGVVSGISTQEAQSGAQQLGQALASGKFQGDELRSILENMPVMARALAKELGVGIGQLKEMGSAGELTADKVFRALLRASAEANAAFEAMPMTVERASSIMAASWGRFVAEIDRSLQRSQSLANTIKYVADQLDRLAKNQTTGGQFDNVSRQITELETYKKQLKKELDDNNGLGFSIGTFFKNNSELADIDKRIARLQASRDVLGENVREEQRLAAQIQQSDRARTASAVASAAQTAAQGAYKDAVKGLFPLEDALAERNRKRADVMSALDAGLISFSQAQKDNLAIEEAYQAKVESVTHAQRDAEKAANDREKAEEKLEKQILAAVKAADAKAVEEYNKVMNEGKRVYESTRTPAEKYADTLVDLKRLLNAGAIDQDTFNRAVQQSDPAFQEAQKAAEKYQQEIQSTAKDIARDWSETLYDAMILQDKQASIIDAIKALGKRIAVALLEANIVLPITTSIVGSVPGLFGIQSPGGSSSAANQNGGMGGLGGQALSLGGKFLPNPFSSGLMASVDQFGYSALGIGTLATTTNTMTTAAAGGLAAELGVAPVAGGVSNAAVAGSTSATAAGGITGGLSGFLGAGAAGLGGGMLGGALGTATNSKAVGGLSGAALGAGASYLGGSILGISAMTGPIGLGIAAAVGLISGLLSTQKATVGKTASADVTINAGGKSATYGNVLTDNDGDPAAGQALGTALSGIYSIAAMGGGKLTKDFGIGQTQKDGLYVAGSVPYKKFGDDIAGLLRYTLLDQGGLQDGGTNTIAALKATKAKDWEEAAKDIGLGASIDAGNTALKEMVKTLSGVTDAAKKATADSFKPMFDELERAKKLGIDGAYKDLATDQLKAYLDQLRNPPDYTEVQTAVATMTGQFQAARDAYAQLNPAMVTYVDQIEKETKAKIAANFNKSLDQQIAEASGRGYVNQINGLMDTLKANAKSLAAVGEPATKAQDLYNASLTSLLKTLTTDQLGDVAKTFGGDIATLATTIQQASTATTAAAAAQEQATRFEGLIGKIRQENAQSELSALNEQKSAANSLLSSWKNLQSSIGQARQSLLVGDLSTLDPKAKMDAALSAYRDALGKAQGGDVDAAGQVSGLAQTALQAARAYYASNQDYARIFDEVTGGLSGVESAAARQVSLASQQVSKLDAQIAIQQDTLKALQVVPADIAAIIKGINSTNSNDVLTWSKTQDTGTQAQIKKAVLESYTNSQIEATFGGFSDIQAARAADPSFNLALWFKTYGMNEVLNGQRSIPGFANGGIVGNGIYGVDSVVAAYAGGGNIALAGGEYVMPADQTAMYRPALDAMRAGTWGAANDRWGGNVAEYRPRTSSGSGGTVVDVKGLESRLDDAVDLLKALVYENSELKTVNKKQAAELSKLRTEAADRDARPRRTGTYGQ